MDDDSDEEKDREKEKGQAKLQAKLGAKEPFFGGSALSISLEKHYLRELILAVVSSTINSNHISSSSSVIKTSYTPPPSLSIIWRWTVPSSNRRRMALITLGECNFLGLILECIMTVAAVMMMVNSDDPSLFYDSLGDYYTTYEDNNGAVDN